MQYGLIGEHLGHSFSKEIHNLIGDYRYELKEIAPDKLEEFISSGDFKGINVTIPYKQDVIPMLDSVADAALSIGAVNTIVNRDGVLTGYNTDYLGMKSMIEYKGIELTGKKVLILGTGGTSKTAKAVASDMGAEVIIKVSRSGKGDAITYEEAYEKHSDASCIINTTPSGMYPDINSVPIDIDRFEGLTGVVDAIYNPLNTKLVRDAGKKGIKATGGLFMLVAQAVKAAELFFDTTYSDGLMESIFRTMESKKGNIVLVGMPGSGKSSVGQALSERLNIPFIDTDALIVKKAGMEITDIFAEYGETYFRDLESRVIADLAADTGVIISTGGGAVLRDENVYELKANGRLFLLDRPVDNIKPTDDRPLADNRDKLLALYNERKPIYEACCDEIIDAGVALEEVVKEVLVRSGLFCEEK